MPYIQLAMERSKKDWVKAVGEQASLSHTVSPFAYLKVSSMNYISISIFILCFIYYYFRNLYNHLNPPNWDLQDDHSLLHTNNLRGIDPYSRKVYYLDDPVHLLVSCIEVVNEKQFIKTCVQSFWRRCLRSQFRAPSFWRRCRGLFEFGQLTVHLVAQIR